MELFMDSQNKVDVRLIDQQKRDLVLILPGGGYHITSPREAIPVAQVYEKASFHTAIYYYRQTLLQYPYLHEEGEGFLKKLAQMGQVNRIFIVGFSAGGHFACHLAERYPNFIKGTILAYPVITSDPKFAHMGSLHQLMGEPLSDQKRDLFSLEKHVHQSMHPVFVWHTMDDVVVPVENTLFLVSALRDIGVKVECHLYPSGRHGLSLGTKETSFEDMDPFVFEQTFHNITSWAGLSITFLKGL